MDNRSQVSTNEAERPGDQTYPMKRKKGETRYDLAHQLDRFGVFPGHLFRTWNWKVPNKVRSRAKKGLQTQMVVEMETSKVAGALAGVGH